MSTKKKPKPVRRRKPVPLPAPKSGTYMLPPDRVLVLRACNADMTSHGDFVWPRSGPVEARDFRPTSVCGNGLHGWLWASGDINASSGVHERPDAVWLVVEVATADAIDLSGKVKFPRGNVVLTGSRDEAVSMIAAQAPAGTAIMWGTATAGDAGTATAGYAGTATAGYAGTATAGVRGTATAGVRGTATAGDAGTATAGYAGTATAGVRGTATAGDAGTATAGVRGTATAGVRGTATAGEYGCVCVEYYDATKSVYRKVVREVDGVTIKAGVAYVVKSGELVENGSA